MTRIEIRNIRERNKAERDAIRDTILVMYDDNAKDAEIAAVLGLTERQVMNTRQRMGLPSKHRGYLMKKPPTRYDAPEDPLDPEIDAKAMAWHLASNNMPLHMIAINMRITEAAAAELVRQMPPNWREWSKDDGGQRRQFYYRGSRRGGGKKRVPE